ncbi:hypothetical protein ABK905_21765 [Acerihabitans sp. KWT182]|uniref:Uncharacterized protein n=1 Tax=Acerihabitans sp. KWT182 TaxID=3157919 RepID=A0AAU7Q7H0_9GAMM
MPIKKEYGNGNKHPDWSDTDIFNYILINKEKALIIDHANLASMLHFSKERNRINWHCFFYYLADHCQPIESINYFELFNEHFTLFSQSYHYDMNKSRFEKLIDILNLCEYESRFKSVIAGEPVSHADKLIQAEDQLRLHELFQDVMSPKDTSPKNASPIDANPIDANPIDASSIDASPKDASPKDASLKETVLKTAHISVILDVFQLEEASDTLKAQTFSVLRHYLLSTHPVRYLVRKQSHLKY